jgi:twinkle protein
MVVRLNVRYGWKAAFFSPENLPMKYHASKIIEKLTGKKFSESTMSAVEYEAAKHYYSSNFKHILPEEKYTLDAILDKAKFLVRRNGIKVLVIDPYNRIESDIGTQSETNYISKILDQLTNFAQRNDVLVCLMAHPRKINKSENADGIPTFYDINGSANFYNKADFGLIVHRNRDEGYTLVRVAKVKFRHLGENGDALFKYNTENGRYTPFVEGQPCVFDNRSYLGEREEERVESAPLPPESNYDFLSDVGDDCPF